MAPSLGHLETSVGVVPQVAINLGYLQVVSVALFHAEDDWREPVVSHSSGSG